ncbi:hypothetical protein LCGC14_2194250 [marine sediment metagenome]|uniref:Uncharacterized protein n=1 Tax=marine sediment metagenome TaxID=412755 RepID=A0A0F9E5N6_9ZZZZ
MRDNRDRAGAERAIDRAFDAANELEFILASEERIYEVSAGFMPVATIEWRGRHQPVTVTYAASSISGVETEYFKDINDFIRKLAEGKDVTVVEVNGIVSFGATLRESAD